MKKLNKMYNKAIELASLAHDGQYRKYPMSSGPHKGVEPPYIIHPIRVADRVWSQTGDMRTTAAALLHDVIEDTTVTYDELRKYIGTDVAKLVNQLTHPDVVGNRGLRKNAYCDQMRNADPRAMTVKIADMIDNAPSIIKHDPKFAIVWMKEAEAMLLACSKGNHALFGEMSSILEGYKNKVAEWGDGVITKESMTYNIKQWTKEQHAFFARTGQELPLDKKGAMRLVPTEQYEAEMEQRRKHILQIQTDLNNDYSVDDAVMAYAVLAKFKKLAEPASDEEMEQYRKDISGILKPEDKDKLREWEALDVVNHESITDQELPPSPRKIRNDAFLGFRDDPIDQVTDHVEHVDNKVKKLHDMLSKRIDNLEKGAGITAELFANMGMIQKVKK